MPKKEKRSNFGRFIQVVATFTRSIWFFPFILTVALLVLTCCKISGSSIGIYHELMYGDGSKDSSLLLNKPQLIRSDEWLVNTQMTIAQKNNHYARINHNIGNGEDMSVILDVPNRDWSEAFRPHNLPFFVLPFDYAFALKWWLLAYLLLLSCYFFILAVLPGRKLLAVLLSIAFLYSPFIQWWYQYITLGPLYYSLFIATAFIYMFRVKSRRQQLLLGGLLAYLFACFGLVLYPSFQIVCAIVLAVFFIGLLQQQRDKLPLKELVRRLAIMAVSLVLAGAVVGAFIATRSAVVHTTENTAYPGQRHELSGGQDPYHIFSGHLALQLQSLEKASLYKINGHASNQSSAANFIYLLPFLILPALLLAVTQPSSRRALEWALALLAITFAALLFRMFIPHLNWLFNNFLFLSKVLNQRLIMGLGLLDLMFVVLFIKLLASKQKRPFHLVFSIIYAVIVFGIELTLAVHARHQSPEFISKSLCIVLSIPLALSVFLILQRQYSLSAGVLAVFMLCSSFAVNPFYRGTAVLTDNAVSKAIQQLPNSSAQRLLSDDRFYENYASLNGRRSLSGVYTYPQKELWQNYLNPDQSGIYNRYAHVVFSVNRQTPSAAPAFTLIAPDNFQVTTGACSSFLHQEAVRYILTSVPIDDNCASRIQSIRLPAANFYLYRLR